MGQESVEDDKYISMQYISNFLQFDASDPKDRVFALLGVFKIDITVDYTKSVREVYLELSREWLRQVGTLDMLSYAGCGLFEHLADHFSLPTWVPDWNRLPKIGGYISTRSSFADDLIV